MKLTRLNSRCCVAAGLCYWLSCLTRAINYSRGNIKVKSKEQNWTSLLSGVFKLRRNRLGQWSGGCWYVGYPSWYKAVQWVYSSDQLSIQDGGEGWLEIESIGEQGVVQGICTPYTPSIYSWLFLVRQLESQLDNAQLNFSLTRLVIIYLLIFPPSTLSSGGLLNL